MLRAVLDANIYISAVLGPDGPPGRIIDRFLREAAFDIVLTPDIVEEIVRAFSYPKVRNLIRSGIHPELWFESIVLLAEMVPGEYEVSGVCGNPDDDKYLGAALEGRATFVVTGDQDFLSIEEYRDVGIVRPRTFLSCSTTPEPSLTTLRSSARSLRRPVVPRLISSSVRVSS